MYSGRPSGKAQSINPRAVIAGSTVYRVSGEAVVIDEILPSDDTTVAIVVFLRSFGCPFCQELLLKYSREVEMLVESNIKLIVIGIGKPSVGKELITHLQIPNGDQFVFADPENILYDRLDLNRGVPSTFFSIATPLALGDRFLKGDTKDLGEVLEKWKNGMDILLYLIPPFSFCVNNIQQFYFMYCHHFYFFSMLNTIIKKLLTFHQSVDRPSIRVVLLCFAVRAQFMLIMTKPQVHMRIWRLL
jgi:hypothetical protein